jgi:hypothetical protein
MAATNLSDAHLPARAIAQLTEINVEDWIYNHKFDVGRSWWTRALQDRGFDDTLVGDTMRRGDVFALADQAVDDPNGALNLLWNALAWGSGSRRRNNKARIASVARDRDTAAGILQRAAELSRTDPLAAYDTLYPQNSTAISYLGPAFFTKFLYFAGGGAAGHQCCILDENVALALHKTCGWQSLPLKNWLATAYERYAALLARWVCEHSLQRRDVIERWLFEEGKRLRS